MKINNDTTYKTSSLPIACVLSLKYSLLAVDKTDPKRSLFVFEKSSGVEEMINEYWEGTLKVEPQTYFNQLKTLKGRIYSD